MFEDTLFGAMANPSILHWLAMMFGQWIYALGESGDAINHPVSAFMIVLASLSICAIIAFVIVMSLLGGRAIVSTGATAKVASQSTGFMPVRVISALFIIMPTTYGISELDQYNVSVSNGQVVMVQGSIWGGGVSDLMFQLGGESLIKYNVSGNPPLNNSVNTSNVLAKAFVCNAFYHKNVGSQNGESLITYRIWSEGSSHMPLTSVDSVSQIIVPNLDKLDAPAELLVQLGGKKGYCGGFSFTFEPYQITKGNSLISELNESLFAGLKEMKTSSNNIAQLQFVNSLGVYETFGDRYYTMFAGVDAEDLSETAIAETGDTSIDATITVNEGGLQNLSAAKTLEDKIAATTDALNYLAIHLSYTQSEISTSTSNAIYSELTGVKNSEGSMDGFSEKLFKEQMGDYISAGMFWAVFQGVSDVMYDTARKINTFTLANKEIDEVRICQDTNIMKRAWKSVSSAFGEDRYLCQSSQHVKEGFAVILGHAATKSKYSLPSSIAMASGRRDVNQDVWTTYFSSSSSEDTASIRMDGYQRALVYMVESVYSATLWFSSDDSKAGGGLISQRSLFSGSNALMMDTSGTTSPFSLVTQLGQQTRDLAFAIKIGLITLEAVIKTANQIITGVANESTSNPILQMMTGLKAIGIFALNLAVGAVTSLFDVLMTMYHMLVISSLGLVYGIPLIPVSGWVFVMIGIFFAIAASTAAINFAAIPMILPKGDGVFAPDTERILSLMYGVFLRQPITVVGFFAHLVIAYIGLSFLNLAWVGAFANKFDGLSLLDGIMWVIVFFIGYVTIAFFICMYSFKVIGKLVDTIGVWLSTHLVGGAFGSTTDDSNAAAAGFTNLSNKLDSLANQFDPSRPKAPKPSGGASSGEGGDNPKANPHDTVNA